MENKYQGAVEELAIGFWKISDGITDWEWKDTSEELKNYYRSMAKQLLSIKLTNGCRLAIVEDVEEEDNEPCMECFQASYCESVLCIKRLKHSIKEIKEK